MSTANVGWTSAENKVFTYYYLYTGLTYTELVAGLKKQDGFFPFHDQYHRPYSYHLFEKRAQEQKNFLWSINYLKGGRIIRYIHPSRVDKLLTEVRANGENQLSNVLSKWNTSPNPSQTAGREGFGTRFEVRTVRDIIYWKDFRGEIACHTVHPRSWREEWLDGFLTYYATPDADWENDLMALRALTDCGLPSALRLKYSEDLDLIRAARDFWVEWGFLRGEEAEAILAGREAERKEKGVTGYSRKVPRFIPTSDVEELDVDDLPGASDAAEGLEDRIDTDNGYSLPFFARNTSGDEPMDGEGEDGDTEGEDEEMEEEDEDGGKAGDPMPLDYILEDEVLDLFFSAEE